MYGRKRYIGMYVCTSERWEESREKRREEKEVELTMMMMRQAGRGGKERMAKAETH
jgi:hypothetical protein